MNTKEISVGSMAVMVAANPMGDLKKINGVDMMSHIQLAHLVNKRPDNVKRSMKELMEQGHIHVTQIEEHTGYNNQTRMMFYVNERDSHVVVARESAAYTAYLVDFWMSRRNQTPAYTIPQTYAEALRLAADQTARVEEQQKLIEQQDVQLDVMSGELMERDAYIAEKQPKVNFVEGIFQSTYPVKLTKFGSLLKSDYQPA